MPGPRSTLITATLLAVAAVLPLGAEESMLATRPPHPAEREAAVELSCDAHQRPRPCREKDGSEGFHCVATSPLAAVLHWLERPSAAEEIGDEVRTVTRQRLAPVVTTRVEVRTEVRPSTVEPGATTGVEAAAVAPPTVAPKVRTDRPACRLPRTSPG